MAAATPAFELRGASKRFGAIHALHPTQLRIEQGSTTALIGPSGCGKSTLLRLLIGLVRPDTGSVLFEGEPIRAENVLALRRRMGFVVQEGGLFPHLSAARNATLMARYLGWQPPQVEARLRELAGLTRLPLDCLSRYPAELSGGQRQRVSLMRALMLDPEVLLLDEPLGALDPLIRYDLQADLRRIFETLRKTVVLVTHDMGEAAFLGDTVVLMRDGRVVQAGTPADLAAAPVDPFVTRFMTAQRFANPGVG